MARGLFTIQNYTPLKLIYHLLNCKNCLTIIKNYTPLKLLMTYSNYPPLFDNHKKLHTSQTCYPVRCTEHTFDNHKKLHTYQTVS